MQGLALGQNTITFYTHFSESTRQQAGLFNGVMHNLVYRKKALLRRLISRLLSYDMVQRATDAFPQFAHIFRGWTPHQDIAVLYKQDFDCGEAPSTWDDFIGFVFNLLSKHSLFHDEAELTPGHWISEIPCNIPVLGETSPEPWLIPNPSEFDRLAKILDVEPRAPAYFARLRYRYSAASVALHFLHGLPSSCRKEVRNVILHEDRESGSNAASHGRGFIPLCQTNRRLRVQRIVNVWSSVFRVRPELRVDYIIRSAYENSDIVKDDRLFSSTITKAVGAWIAEAQALLSLGMPQKSFSMLLDGNPTPEHTSTVFQIVQRDVAWQSSLDAAYDQGHLPTPTWYERRSRAGYNYEGLPSAMRNMSTAGPGEPISCNFDVGQPDDVETLLALHRGWTPKQWADHWGMHQPQSFQTEHPLPPWHELKWLRVTM